MFILKLLRQKKNISQTNLANAIGVSLRTIQLYEKKDANIPKKNLDKIANFFNLSISELYASEVNEVDVVYKKLTKSKTKEQLHKITKLGPGKYVIKTPLIIAENQIEYTKNYNNFTFLKQMPSISFVVENVSVSQYISFEITNNSMWSNNHHGLPNKAIVLGKISTIKELGKSSNAFESWIIVLENVVMCKQIINYDKRNGTVTCHSLNTSPEFPDFTINLDDVKLLFRVIKKQVY